jgi:hypothetical protein
VHAKIVHIISIFHQRALAFDTHHSDDDSTTAEGLPTSTIIIEPYFLLEGRERKKKGLGVVFLALIQWNKNTNWRGCIQSLKEGTERLLTNSEEKNNGPKINQFTTPTRRSPACIQDLEI